MHIERFEVVKRRAEMALHGNTSTSAARSPTIPAVTSRTRPARSWRTSTGCSRASAATAARCSVRILLAHREDYAGLNQVWDQWFPEGRAPTRACSLAELIDPRWRVEMIVVAARPQ